MGRATSEKLITLARAACEQPLPVLVIAGWLTEEEIGSEAVILMDEERDLLRLYRLAIPSLRHASPRSTARIARRALGATETETVRDVHSPSSSSSAVYVILAASARRVIQSLRPICGLWTL